MSNLNPLSTHVEQLATKIRQLKNTPIARLQAHSDWQTHHISAIEDYNRNLESHIQELEIQNNHLQDIQIQNNKSSPNNLTSQFNSPNSAEFIQFPMAVLNTENKVLDQIHENTLFLQNLIQQQQRDLQKRNLKINKMQHSVSWQVTGPLRATGKFANNVTNVSSKVFNLTTTPISKVYSYINQRPKLKKNLLKLIGVQKLYSSK